MTKQSITTQLDSIVTAITEEITLSVAEQIKKLVKAEVQKQFSEVKPSKKSAAPVSEIISGDQIKGGIITEFSSTGIDDRATNCVLTLLDESVVIENNLLTKDLTVQGNLDVRGTLLDTSVFYKQLTNLISAEVAKSAPVHTINTVPDQELIPVTENNIAITDTLDSAITTSSLTKLGILKSLEVDGESWQNGTLYVGEHKIGVNTLAPASVFNICDEETEIRIGKLRYGVVHICAPSFQTLILSSNHKPNVVLGHDGSAKIDDLRINHTKITSSSTPPTDDSIKGHIVFNSNPTVGGPIGWVYLGDNAWGNFGTID